MEEIKVGEYVRIKQARRCFISKVYEIGKGKTKLINTIYYCIVKGEEEWFTEENIIKHSSNIKDLVQAGDIVIYTINCKMTDIDIVKEHTDARTLKKTLRVGLWSLEQVDIKQILTKEKFESESYRLEAYNE